MSSQNQPDLTGREASLRESSTATTTAPLVDARFSCNICLDSVVEPVVTQCGHLYCWPCLYRWLEPSMYPEERASLGLGVGGYNVNVVAFDSSRRVCPVCKSVCSVPTLVPIYVRSSNEQPSPVHSATNIAQQSTQRQFQNEEDENATVSSTIAETTIESAVGSEQNENEQQEFVPSSTGLRQRRTVPQRQQPSGGGSHTSDQRSVPNRPAASSPQHSSSDNNPNQHGGISNQSHGQGSSNNNNNNTGGGNPNWGRTTHGSLTHGILMSFQQAAVAHGMTNSNNDNGDGQGPNQQQRAIPSLHNIRDGSFDNSNGGYSYNSHQIDVNSETTQYLSRLLIMLTSFVVLCLLLF